MAAQATLLTVFVLMANTLLRPQVNAINRLPLSEAASDATYEVPAHDGHGICAIHCELLESETETASYPVNDVEVGKRRRRRRDSSP